MAAGIATWCDLPSGVDGRRCESTAPMHHAAEFGPGVNAQLAVVLLLHHLALAYVVAG